MGARDSRRRCALYLAALCAALAQPAARGARAETGALAFAPADTRIRFEVDSTLHRVVGSARLSRGELRFDTETGSASGSIAVDARSADTDNDLRDAALHGDVLESERYPEIVFLAERIALVRSAEDRGEVELTGRLRIHGGEHPLRIGAQVERDGDAVRLRGSFRIPYVAWGMRDKSNWLLRVAPEVEIWVDALASLRSGPAAADAGAAP
jgi:polyisoprenoid-binding protein YceI